MADSIVIEVTEVQDVVTINLQDGVTAPVLFGTGSPPDPAGFVDGTIYFQIT